WPPEPPTATLPLKSASNAIETLVAWPPLPPLPPTLCAKTPLERKPVVVIDPEWVTSTSPAVPPPAPLPPTETLAEMAGISTPSISIGNTRVPVVALPPAPPLPPTLCAKTPSLFGPSVARNPAFDTATRSPLPPAPPEPPTPTATATGPARERLVESPPLPPPPPTLCAKTPVEWLPRVVIAPELKTSTTPPTLPAPPPPPTVVETDA